jgi:RHS repeat-associated protein
LATGPLIAIIVDKFERSFPQFQHRHVGRRTHFERAPVAEDPARHGNTVGGFLLSATNPENGTVTYTYGGNNLIATKTDAKGQLLTYAYDGYNRLTSVTWTNAPGGAQVLRTYYYDTNPLDPTGMFSQYALGRLTAVQYPQFATNVQMNDMYSYSQAGLPAAKRLQVNQLVAYDDVNNHLQHQTVTVNLDSTYTYNDEGQVTAMTYPSTIGVLNVVTAGASYNYSYDSMNRLSGMTSGSTTVVSGVSYDQANRLLGMTFNGKSETRGYNVLGQLTNLYNSGGVNLTYNYPTGTNNGKVSSMYNAVSGETVTYAYDSLNRMATAAGSGWGETYTLDPYGNLTTKQVTSGSAPSLSVSVNPANNQVAGSYDANGNSLYSPSATPLAYDAENRVSGVGWNNSAPAVDYSYDAQNKRIFMWTAGTLDSFSNVYNYSVVFYSPSGKKLGTYLLAPQQPYFQGGINTPYITASLASSDQYFGGRRLAPMDQLGSAGTYYPWGEAKGGTNPQDTWSYATYWRDSATGLDYANNRYYSNVYGRFMTPDPYTNSGRLTDPQSWNRYAYTRGDPVSRVDPKGTDDCPYLVCVDVSSWGDPFDGFWDVAGPFNNGPSFGYACMFGFIPGCNLAQGGGGGGGVPAGYSIPGIMNAYSALQNLLTQSLSSGPCQADLSALDLAQAAAGTTGSVGQPVSAQAIDAVASTIQQSGYIYDGGTSPTPYTVANFGSLPTGTPFPGETVGNVFTAFPGVMALSQKTGYAIFVNSPAWAGFGSAYATATLLHEIIHKFGLTDGQMAKALGVDITTTAGTSALSTKLQTDCIK